MSSNFKIGLPGIFLLALLISESLVSVHHLYAETFPQCTEEAGIKVVAEQLSIDPTTKLINEISGIAIAGFKDKEGRLLLWGHEENKRRLMLLSTQGAKLYAGTVPMYGRAPNDAEDIAAARDSSGNNLLYLADTGNNSNKVKVCVSFERDKEDPSLCRLTKGEIQYGGYKVDFAQGTECLEKGQEWLWINQSLDPRTDRFPEIWRIKEPSYLEQALRQGVTEYTRIRFSYPAACGALPCGEFKASGLEDYKGKYNVEALAVIPEPDGSHSAYMFTKAHKSLEKKIKTQRPDLPPCRFEEDGISEVFRLVNIDTLAEGVLHLAEYISTINFSADKRFAGNRFFRITAADYLALDKHSGLLVVKTKDGAFRWPVLSSDIMLDGHKKRFDLKTVLARNEPCRLNVPVFQKFPQKVNGKIRVEEERQEAVAQTIDGRVFHIGECKHLDKCRLFEALEKYKQPSPGLAN